MLELALLIYFKVRKQKVVLISMATSDVECLPRHKDFFFSRNRLNVAISRAECVAIIIFNENLLLASYKFNRGNEVNEQLLQIIKI